MVRGRVVVDCQLSGVPDLVLKLSQPHLLDDVAFHSCVRLARFQREKVTLTHPTLCPRLNSSLRLSLSYLLMASFNLWSTESEATFVSHSMYVSSLQAQLFLLQSNCCLQGSADGQHWRWQRLDQHKHLDQG